MNLKIFDCVSRNDESVQGDKFYCQLIKKFLQRQTRGHQSLFTDNSPIHVNSNILDETLVRSFNRGGDSDVSSFPMNINLMFTSLLTNENCAMED